jgi:hypothetical protein
MASPKPVSCEIGTVTKIGATQWLARYRSGENAGTFDSLRAGQRVIEASLGGRLLKWALDPSVGRAGIEQWVGAQPGLDCSPPKPVPPP